MASTLGQADFAMRQVRPPEAGPLRAPHMEVDDFLPVRLAEEMREGIDAHFAEPHQHRPDVHQVWNYWYVPDLYTYLRTMPEKIIARDLVQRFHDALSAWARDNLGMGRVTWPYLSLYVDGCQQALHNDSVGGRFGFVYSLTWDDRKTIGGETIVLREGDLFRSNMTSSAAGWNLFEMIPPRFNRLVIFDDRMPHGVQRVEGAMDPLEGRFVLHGHISEAGPIVNGALGPEAVARAIDAELGDYAAGLAAGEGEYHGPLVLRLAVAPSGEVRSVRPLLDRLARRDGGPTEEAVARILAMVAAMRFPAADGATDVTAPLLIGGPLPRPA
jgi:Rps23 Pro-64 3,4-dihydroxylase Tpa1-like proline 4-hydroxylase